MIHASLMEMNVSVTSVCSFEKLNRRDNRRRFRINVDGD